MLERCIIRNFQCHSRLVVDFDPLLTTITGPSDTGKSAILRALRWVMLNRPRGRSFARDSRCKVTLEIDGHVVTREIGKGENTYKLDDRTYEAFGNDVPDPIAAIFNVNEENFQRQHEPNFWFHRTPGEVSRELNRIVDLERIDSVLSSIASELRKEVANNGVIQNRLLMAANTRAELAWIEQAHQELDSLENSQNDVVHLREEIRLLSALIDESLRLASTIQIAKDHAVLQEKLLYAINDIITLVRDIEELEDLCREMMKINEDLTHARRMLSSVSTELENEAKKGCPLCGSKRFSLRISI